MVGLEGDPDQFRKTLMELSDIESISYSNAVPGKVLGMQSFQNGNDRTSNLMMYIMHTDSLFFSTYGMVLKKGSYLRSQYASKDTIDVIVNEEAVKYLGLKDPIGATIYRKSGDTSTNCLIIKGVVADFNFESLHTRIQPLIILPGQLQQIKFATIRFSHNVKN